MKKLFIVLALLSVSTVFATVTSDDMAQDRDHIIAIADDLALGTSTEAYTDPVKLTNSDHHGLYLRIQSSGTVSFTVKAEYSIRSDTGFTDAPEPITFATITDSGNKIVKLNGLAHMSFIRFKFTSDSSNASDVLIDCFFVRDTKQK